MGLSLGDRMPTTKVCTKACYFVLQLLAGLMGGRQPSVLCPLRLVVSLGLSIHHAQAQDLYESTQEKSRESCREEREDKSEARARVRGRLARRRPLLLRWQVIIAQTASQSSVIFMNLCAAMGGHMLVRLPRAYRRGSSTMFKSFWGQSRKVTLIRHNYTFETITEMCPGKHQTAVQGTVSSKKSGTSGRLGGSFDQNEVSLPVQAKRTCTSSKTSVNFVPTSAKKSALIGLQFHVQLFWVVSLQEFKRSGSSRDH